MGSPRLAVIISRYYPFEGNNGCFVEIADKRERKGENRGRGRSKQEEEEDEKEENDGR